MYTGEITQQHLDLVQGIARKLASTPDGRLVGEEELYSEGIVILAELIEGFDPELGFWEGYMCTRVRFKLIDWLRTVVGRYGREHNRISHNTYSLDEKLEAEEGHNDARVSDLGWQIDTSPSVEETICARDWLSRVAHVLRELPEAQREAMLWPTRPDPTPQAFAHAYGRGLNYARKRAREAIEDATGEVVPRGSGGRPSATAPADGLCVEPGCKLRWRSKGMCQTHYTRYRQAATVSPRSPLRYSGASITAGQKAQLTPTRERIGDSRG